MASESFDLPIQAAREQALDTLAPDPTNRRTHTARNVAMITASLRSVGAARSIVIDEHDEVLAGNGVVQAAGAAGITKVHVVEVDGDTLVAVRRRGLTPAQKRELAIFDNRTAELAEWNVAQLQADHDAGLDLLPFFFEAERDALLHGKGGTHPVEFTAVDETLDTAYQCPSCGYEWSGKPKPSEPPQE